MAESSSIPGTTKPAADMNTDSIRDKTVLVLEDEPLIALDLKFGLESGGSVVQCAYTLEQGLDILKTEVIDAAILDVNLGRDTTCAPMATQLKERGIPFILHSGDLDRHGELISSLEAKIVPKPAHHREVIATLCSVME